MSLAPLLLALAACAPDADKQDTGPLDTGTAAVKEFPEFISEDRLLASVEELASEAYGGRRPGTEGGELATSFVEAAFAAAGLQPATGGSLRMPFDISVWEEVSPPELALAGTTLARGDDWEPFDGSGSADVTAEVVFAGYGLTVPAFDPATYPDCPLDPAGYDDYAGVDVDGRVVLVFRHGPNDDQDIYNGCPGEGYGRESLFLFGYKVANAAAHGAAAVLLVNDDRHEQEHDTGSISSEFTEPDVPALFVDRDPVVAALPDLLDWQHAIDGTLAPASRATGVEAHVKVDQAVVRKTVENVVGVLPGSDLAQEAVVVGAHFDHMGTDSGGNVYTGADDNASGTAVVMELATAMAEAGLAPRRTIIFAGFNAEEMGLLGSVEWVRNPPWPLEDTVAMLNADMVGGGEEEGLGVYGGLMEELAWLPELMEEMADVDFPVVPQVPSGASDHAPFLGAGVPAVLMLTEGRHPVYHTPADTFDTISGLELSMTAHLAGGALLSLALGTEEEVLGAPVARRLGAVAAPLRAPPPQRGRWE